MCAFLSRIYISLLHHSFTSSSHTLLGLLLFVFPSISPKTTSIASLQMYPNKFDFLSLILYDFSLAAHSFCISSFVISTTLHYVMDRDASLCYSGAKAISSHAGVGAATDASNF